MTRRIDLPSIDWSQMAGAAVEIPVVVDWPELQLTDDQVAQNAVAFAAGVQEPHPNPAIFTVLVRRPR